MKLLTRENVKYEGVEVIIGADSYIVPALSLGQVERFKDVIAKLRNLRNTNDDALLVMPEALEVILAALRRNYPLLTLETIKEEIDVNSFRHIMKAIFGVSGLEAEIEARGEALAAAAEKAAAVASAASPQSKSNGNSSSLM